MRFVQPINPRSLSGAPLDIWNRKVRLIYLDEAGTGSLQDEPFLVIAGVILNADADWRPLQRHIKSLRRKHLPSEDQDNFIFHAHDIFHGTGYFKKERAKWPPNKRYPILHDLADIPKRFRLPIVHQGIDRAASAKFIQAQNQRPATYRDAWGAVRLPPPAPLSDAALATLIHMGAWAQCARSVDQWMEAHANNEVAMLVAENPGKIQKILRRLHTAYANDENWRPERFTTNYIVDTVTFADKQDSILLQIADICCFIIKRQFQGKENTQEFFAKLDDQLVSPARAAVSQKAPRRYSDARRG